MATDAGLYQRQIHAQVMWVVTVRVPADDETSKSVATSLLVLSSNIEEALTTTQKFMLDPNQRGAEDMSVRTQSQRNLSGVWWPFDKSTGTLTPMAAHHHVFKCTWYPVDFPKRAKFVWLVAPSIQAAEVQARRSLRQFGRVSIKAITVLPISQVMVAPSVQRIQPRPRRLPRPRPRPRQRRKAGNSREVREEVVAPLNRPPPSAAESRAYRYARRHQKTACAAPLLPIPEVSEASEDSGNDVDGRVAGRVASSAGVSVVAHDLIDSCPVIRS